MSVEQLTGNDAVPGAIAPPSGAGKSASAFCLIVDDEKGIRNLIARSLRNHLVMTEGCGDAQSALEAMKLRAPDLIFLDVSLERSDAIDVIRGLGDMKFRGPVQLMSGRDVALLNEIKRVGEKYELNMLEVMAKPFRAEIIPAILEKVGIERRPVSAPDAPVGLFEALCAGWIDLCYQPKFELRSGKMIGAEGLVRVVHPTRGVLKPASILVEADDASRLALAECALLKVLKDWEVFNQAGNPLRLSINVPMVALRKLSIAAIVREQKPESPRWPGLILEVSEDQILSDIPLAHEIATHLRIYNVHLAIDRFGSGCGSLGTLRDLPFVELKINSGFVAGCAEDTNHRLLCKAVIDLAHRFERQAVAEGIDRPQDLKALAEMGCDIGQGAALGRTVPKEQLTALIHRQAREVRVIGG
jgi:EAL domain-containing protein (putative c-di-GMP-specific phosphodiesterase class I)/CheY-like chemotaxis protein